MKMSLALLLVLASHFASAVTPVPEVLDENGLVKKTGVWVYNGCTNDKEECADFAENENFTESRASGEAETCKDYAYTCYGKR